MAIATGSDVGSRQPQRNPIRAGLGVLAAAILTMGLTGPGQTIGVSVFIDHFVDDLSISRPQVSTAYLIGTLCASLLLPQVGKVIDRIGVRRSQVVIGIVFAFAIANMSLVMGLVTLTIGFFGIRLLGQGAQSLVAGLSVSLRFTEGRGTALGIHSTVSAGLLAISPILLATAISVFGWRGAWVAAAIVVGLVVPALALVALRSVPTSSAEASKLEQAQNPGTTRQFDRSEAIRTRGFWILAAVSGAAGMLTTALNFHQIDLLGDVGLSSTVAATLFLPQVIGSSIAGVTVGAITDRVGTRFLPTLGAFLLVAAHLLAATAAPGLRVVIYAIVLGAAAGSINTVTNALLPLWFGTRNLGAIAGTIRVLGAGASAIGPVALALLQAQFGSYPPAVLVISTVAAAAMIFSLSRPFPAGQRSDGSAKDRADLSESGL